MSRLLTALGGRAAAGLIALPKASIRGTIFSWLASE
jgi:hypothetical protein